MVDVSIIGGSGYAGGELLRLLVRRGDVDISGVSSERFAGRFIHEVHPNLRGFTDLKFTPHEDIEQGDVLFLALPHRKAQSILPGMDGFDNVIDLSADHRLNSVESYGKWYRGEHSDPKILERFVYGLPELHRDEIRGSNMVASPGCVATASILGLYPFRESAKNVVIDAKIGSSASGNSSSASTHHPERSGVIRPYSPVSHRHQAEIEQETGLDVSMTVHAVEMIRGVSATIHIDVEDDFGQKDAWKLLRRSWGDEPFIRIVKSRKGLYRYPEPKLVAGTNFCDIGFELDRNHSRLVVLSCIDNLVKGSAGSAIQSMNLMLGLEETKGLFFPGLHP